MRKIFGAALFALALPVVSPAQSQMSSTECPTATGAYLFSNGSWKALDAVHSIGFKTTNVAGAAFSYGAAKAKVKAQFREPRSPYQLNGGPFAFCLVGVTDSGRDISVAKFQEEKDRRELALGSYRLWTGINAQIDPKSLIPLSVDKKADKVYLVVGKEALPNGEFILFTLIPDLPAMAKANTATSLGGYDFGTHTDDKK